MRDVRGPRPGEAVVVVGAGPAGLHLADLLVARGFEVTVLDDRREVGGKCETRVVRGVQQELGPVYVTPQYRPLLELMARLGMDPEVELVAPGGRDGRRQVFVDGDRRLGSVLLSEHLFAAVEEDTLPRWLRPLVPDQLQWVTVRRLVTRYSELHRRLLGTYPLRHPPEPSAEVRELLTTSFGAFLRANGLGTLLNLLTFSTAAQGYGQPEDLTAFYGLWWNTPEFLEDYLASARGTGPPIVRLVRSGYQAIWKRLAEQLPPGLIHHGFHVTGIERGERITVHGVRGGRREEVTADFVAWTPPMSVLLRVLRDPTPEETRILSAQEAHTLVTTLFAARSGRVFTPIAYWLRDEYSIVDRGRLFSVRNSARALEQPVEGSSTWVGYQYSSAHALDGQWFATLLRRDLAEWFTDVEILDQRVATYAEGFTREAVREALPWRLWDLQGTERLWYAGSTACFDSVHDVMCYNLKLVDLLR
jgi:hypothetical protein